MRADRPGVSLLEVVVGLLIIGVAAGSAFSVAAMEHGVALRAAATAEVNSLAELKITEYLLLQSQPAPADSLFRRFAMPFEHAEWRAFGRPSGVGPLVEVRVVVRSGAALRQLDALIDPSRHR